MENFRDNQLDSSSREMNERLMELSSLFEILKTLNSSLKLSSVLDNILLTPMGRMMISKGVVLLSRGGTDFVVESIKGLPREMLGKTIHIDNVPERPFYSSEVVDDGHLWVEFLQNFDLQIVFPINTGNSLLGLLVFGKKLGGKEFSSKEVEFLSSISNLSATAIQNSIMFTELQNVNRKLDHSNQELNTLFDIGSELNSTLDEQAIIKVLGFALMGQLLVNKYAIYLKSAEKFLLKGCKGITELSTADELGFNEFLKCQSGPMLIENGTESEIHQWLKERGINLLIPMKIQEVTCGIICLGEKINKQQYSREDMDFLTTLGNQSMVSLENARLFKETLEKQRMEEELAVARDIQAQLLPGTIPERAEVDIHAENISSKAVGGDYYDIIELKNGEMGIVIADVSGKGVPASLLMANVQASFRALAEVVTSTSELTSMVNNIIHKNTSADKFITYFYAKINPDTLEMEYCNAGHNHPMIISEDHEIRLLNKGGLILGMLPDISYEWEVVQLKKGDMIVMYTDGITEALNSEQEEYEEWRLIDLCKEKHALTAREMSRTIIDTVNEFCGSEPQYDDMTLIVAKIR